MSDILTSDATSDQFDDRTDREQFEAAIRAVVRDELENERGPSSKRRGFLTATLAGTGLLAAASQPAAADDGLLSDDDNDGSFIDDWFDDDESTSSTDGLGSLQSAGGDRTLYVQDEEPTDAESGDIWIDTS
jgi:hypothetical protein